MNPALLNSVFLRFLLLDEYHGSVADMTSRAEDQAYIR